MLAFFFEVLPPVDGGVLVAGLAGWRVQRSWGPGLTVRNATTSASDSETAETGDAFERVDLGSFDEVELLGRAIVAALAGSCKTVSSHERRVDFSFLTLTLRGFEGMLRECLVACEERVIREKSWTAKGIELYRLESITSIFHSFTCPATLSRGDGECENCGEYGPITTPHRYCNKSSEKQHVMTLLHSLLNNVKQFCAGDGMSES